MRLNPLRRPRVTDHLGRCSDDDPEVLGTDEVAEWVDDRGVFNEWDIDGDSELDRDEIAERFDVSALGESWTSDPLDEELFSEAYFELCDENLDGEVTESERTDGAATIGVPG